MPKLYLLQYIPSSRASDTTFRFITIKWYHTRNLVFTNSCQTSTHLCFFSPWDGSHEMIVISVARTLHLVAPFTLLLKSLLKYWVMSKKAAYSILKSLWYNATRILDPKLLHCRCSHYFMHVQSVSYQLHWFAIHHVSFNFYNSNNMLSKKLWVANTIEAFKAPI